VFLSFHIGDVTFSAIWPTRSPNSHDPSSTHPDEVLHVKRFCYDVSVGGVVKVMK